MRNFRFVLVLLLVAFCGSAAAPAAASCACNDSCILNVCERKSTDGTQGCSGVACAIDPGDPSRCVGEFMCFESLAGEIVPCGSNMTPANLPDLLMNLAPAQ